MNVRQLREALADEDGDLEVVLQGDSEGNSFSPLWTVVADRFTAESSWSYELDDHGDVHAITLVPVN